MGERIIKVDEEYFLVDDEYESEYVARVSSVINPSSFVPEQYAERGRRVHEWTHLDDLGRITEEQWAELDGTDLKNYLTAWRTVKDKTCYLPIFLEQVVWGELEGMKFAGTIDRLCHFIIGGESYECVVDLKSTTQDKPGMSSKHGQQLAAYLHMASQRGMISPEARLFIVYLKVDGSPVVKEYTDHEKYLAKFTRLLRKHYDEKEMEDAIPESQ